jgi:hypothetical protein
MTHEGLGRSRNITNPIVGSNPSRTVGTGQEAYRALGKTWKLLFCHNPMQLLALVSIDYQSNSENYVSMTQRAPPRKAREQLTCILIPQNNLATTQESSTHAGE